MASAVRQRHIHSYGHYALKITELNFSTLRLIWLFSVLNRTRIAARLRRISPSRYRPHQSPCSAFNARKCVPSSLGSRVPSVSLPTSDVLPLAASSTRSDSRAVASGAYGADQSMHVVGVKDHATANRFCRGRDRGALRPRALTPERVPMHREVLNTAPSRAGPF
jgi:hypothetical protein